MSPLATRELAKIRMEGRVLELLVVESKDYRRWAGWWGIDERIALHRVELREGREEAQGGKGGKIGKTMWRGEETRERIRERKANS